MTDVRQGKRFELTLGAEISDGELEQIAESLLANTVIESYRVEVVP